MRVYGIWNVDKKGFWSSDYGCDSGVKLKTFRTRDEAERFADGYASFNFIIKGISVFI